MNRNSIRNKLVKKLGIKLIPLIVVDERGGNPKTILEISSSPYRELHKYFQDPIKK